ncbi:MAG: hypothetical protein AB1609_21800, partial [Bacillota bacterium]
GDCALRARCGGQAGAAVGATRELAGGLDQAHEALRDVVRAREDAKQDRHRKRQQVGKFLLRWG